MNMRANVIHLALLLVSGWPHLVFAVGDALSPAGTMSALVTHSQLQANFALERASPDAWRVAGWVVGSGDNRRMPFLIVDKVDAKVFAFTADGQISGSAAVLLGTARGDGSAPGIGSKKLAAIRPEERTTPAGRFVASLGQNARGAEVLWVDYENAISLHRVITSKPAERRLQRLATPTPLDNRISHGCINVPVMFFENVVSPAFTGTNGIVYVLPETRPAQQVFGMPDVEAHASHPSAKSAVPPAPTFLPSP
jgi:hypothetical protein